MWLKLLYEALSPDDEGSFELGRLFEDDSRKKLLQARRPRPPREGC